MEWSAVLSAIQLDQVAWAGLVMLGLFAILSGRLVPARTVDEITKERDSWKMAYLETEKANRILLKQNSDLIDASETTAHLIRSLPHVADGTQK